MIFRNWVLENFPFLEDDFDALTDYELFCKMMEYVKKFAKDNIDFNKRLTDLENYINNLDIQTAVNNKLDEMAESGELEEIMSAYLNTRALFCYDTVNDLKEATNLINGSYAKTLGYYAVNDGGSALYYIDDNNNTTNNYSNILLDNGLKANLVFQKCYNVEVFGVKGDGTTDDRIGIQNAINYSGEIQFLNKTYAIDCVDELIINDDIHKYPTYNGGITIPSNKIINGLENTILKCISNSSSNYNIFRLCQVDNVKINNIKFLGDKDTHTGTSGEWGHDIMILNSSNIEINNCNIEKAWGDGVYVGVLYNNEIIKQTKNIKIKNCLINDNRRNGIATCSVDSITIENNEISNHIGTNPKAGIDVESEGTNPIVKNVYINNNLFHNNFKSVDLYLNNSSVDFDKIIINNNTMKNETTPIRISTYTDTINHKINGDIVLKDNSLINAGYNALTISNFYTEYFDYINIDGLYIRDCNNHYHNTNNNLEGWTNGSGVVILKENVTNDLHVGNIIIKNVEVIETRETPYNSKAFISYDTTLTHSMQNIKLINPLKMQCLYPYEFIAQGTEVIDIRNVIYNNDAWYENEFSENNTNPLTFTSNVTGSLRSVILNDNGYISNDTTFTFINDGEKNLQIKCGGDSLLPVYNIGDSSIRYIRCTSSDVGAYLKIKKINGLWIAIEQGGNWTRSNSSF